MLKPPVISLADPVVDGEGGIDPLSLQRTYERLADRIDTCGSVLIDRTFTARTECEDYRANNSFTCGGVKLTFSC